MKELEKPKKPDEERLISRKKAIKQIGFGALSAATMMLLLNEPAKGQDNPGSPDNPPDWP
jgi:hypothetical protein